jgi:hypothetical protein
MPDVLLLSVITRSVIILSVIMLSVAALNPGTCSTKLLMVVIVAVYYYVRVFATVIHSQFKLG